MANDTATPAVPPDGTTASQEAAKKAEDERKAKESASKAFQDKVSQEEKQKDLSKLAQQLTSASQSYAGIESAKQQIIAASGETEYNRMLEEARQKRDDLAKKVQATASTNYSPTDPPKLTEEEEKKLSAYKIYEQTILLLNYDKILLNRGINNSNLVRIITKNPETLLSRLFINENLLKSYYNLNSADLSFIVPNVRLFRMYENDVKQELLFSNYVSQESINSITNNLSERGYQANLINLNIQTQGKELAAFHSYTVKMKLLFDSLETCLNDKYLSLFNPMKKTGKVDTDKPDDGNPKYYRILLEIGFKLNDKKLFSENHPLNLTRIQNFCLNSKIRMFLNYVIHELTINEDGSVNLELEYIGASEHAMSNSKSGDVFEYISLNDTELVSARQDIENIENYKEDIKQSYDLEKDDSGNYAAKDRETGEPVTTNSDLKQKLDQLKENDVKIKIYQQKTNNLLLQTIIKNISQIYGYKLPGLLVHGDEYSDLMENYESSVVNKSQVLSAIVTGKNFNNNTLLEPIPEVPSEEQIDKLFDTTDYNIYYFKFSDLINAFKVLNNHFHKILFSDFEFNNLNSDGSNISVFAPIKLMNIGDIPISLTLFKKWYNNLFLNRSSISLPVKKFLDSCIDLITEAVCARGPSFFAKQKVSFGYLVETVEGADLKKYNTSINIDSLNTNDYSLLNAKNDKVQVQQIVLFYVKKGARFAQRKKDREKDLSDGIYHFVYGDKDGIVNSINFRKDEMPYAKEASIQSQRDREGLKLGTLLRGKYNCSIEMFGTLGSRVGSTVYVEPSFIGIKSIKTPIDLGIGGYFTVVSNQINIESGKFTSSLECYWQSKGDGKYTDMANVKTTLKKEEKPVTATATPAPASAASSSPSPAPAPSTGTSK